MYNIYVIGCGGIGGHLVRILPQAIAGLSCQCIADYTQSGYTDTQLLESAGRQAVACIADSITFVDGDTFEPKNALRQGAGLGSKLTTRMREFKDQIVNGRYNEVLLASWLRNMRVSGYPCYVNPDNVSQVIPRTAELNEENLELCRRCLNPAMHRPVTVVFICVDNKKTRYELSRYLETFDDVVIINGGNMLTTGQVTMHVRENGVQLDPWLPDLYPDINPDADKRPDEVSCEYVAPTYDQTAIVNYIVAGFMALAFSNYVRYISERCNGKADGEPAQRVNELLFDAPTYALMPRCHKVLTKE